MTVMGLLGLQHHYRVDRDMVEVTSSSRPDPAWVHTDPAGHEHRWFVGDAPAPSRYDPSLRYHVPTTHEVQVGTTWYEGDDEETPVYETQCRVCGAVVRPGTASDDTRQYIAGLAHYTVDGQLVSRRKYAETLVADLTSSGQSVPDWLAREIATT